MREFGLTTRSRAEFVDITDQVEKAVAECGFAEGLVFIHVPHTTSGVTINEGADPAVARDLIAALDAIVPSAFDYRHLEGNSPAHLKSSLVGSGVHVIVSGGRLRLGRWQRIFFCEFDGPRTRRVWMQFTAC